MRGLELVSDTEVVVGSSSFSGKPFQIGKGAYCGGERD